MGKVSCDSAQECNQAPTSGALYWRSRRGMAELEMRLLPFLACGLAGLPAASQVAYARLLTHEDWQILDWLQAVSAPTDPALAAIVDAIRQFEADA